MKIPRWMQILAVVGALATGALLVRSFWRDDLISWERAETRMYATSLRGGVALAWVTGPASDTPGWHWRSSSLTAYTLEEEFDHAFLGFSWETRLLHLRDGTAIVPRKILFRLEAVLFVLVAVAFTPWLIRRRWLAQGKCPACGYIVNHATERCSECGTVVPRRALGGQP